MLHYRTIEKMDQEQSVHPMLPHSKEFLAWKCKNRCPDFMVLKAKQKGRTTLRYRQSEIKIRETVENSLSYI